VPGTGSTAPASPSNEALAAALEDERRRLSIPGAVALVSSASRGTWTQAFGVADVATGAKLTTGSHLRIASVTKTIVALIVLRLAEAGELALDDEIRVHLPQLPVPGGVTVRRLLNMTSGLPDYTSDEFVAGTLVQPGRVWTPVELLDIAFRHPQRSEPGGTWDYCNAGYIILGMLIESLKGERVEVTARRLVLDPLGMRDTHMPPLTRDGAGLPDPYVRGYHRRDGELIDATNINPSWGWTAGNAVSTAHDLAVLVESSVRGDLLQEQTRIEQMTGVPIAGSTWSYGLGIADFDGLWGHNGEMPGFQSFAGHDPQTGLTVVVLTNVDGVSADALAGVLRTELGIGGAVRPAR